MNSTNTRPDEARMQPNRCALAIRHVAFEDLGILAPLLTERGYDVRYLEAGVDTIDAATLIAADLVVLHWHGDQFGIPDGASRLAQRPGFPNQAFSFGPRSLGLQFHLEADHAQIERWLIGHACELGLRQIEIQAIRRDAAQYGPRLQRAAREAIEAWLDQG